MYESPINICQRQMATSIVEEMNNTVYKAVLEYGVDVNKEELLKALKYDRDQYIKGHEDGLDESWARYTLGCEDGKYSTAMEIKKWLLDMCDAHHGCVSRSDIERFFKEMYDSNGENDG